MQSYLWRKECVAAFLLFLSQTAVAHTIRKLPCNIVFQLRQDQTLSVTFSIFLLGIALSVILAFIRLPRCTEYVFNAGYTLAINSLTVATFVFSLGFVVMLTHIFKLGRGDSRWVSRTNTLMLVIHELIESFDTDWLILNSLSLLGKIPCSDSYCGSASLRRISTHMVSFL